MKTKKRILSVLLSMSMVIPTIILPQSVMAEDVVTEDTTVETDDENTVISYNFDDGVVPAGFSYKKTEGYDPTITAANGRMQYKTKSSKGSGLLFDLSSLVSLAEQRCEKLIFEYDYYPEVLEYTSTRYLYTRIVDNNGKFYNQFYNVSSSESQKFYDTTSKINIPMTSWNRSTTDTDKYYKVKITFR